MSWGDREEKQLLHRILGILERAFAITNFELHQIIEETVMAITGVQAGGSGTFQIGFVPPNGAPLTSGPTVSTSDTLVTLGPVGPNGQFTASVAASDTATTFPVVVAGVNGAGTAISHTFSIPIIAAPPPQITDFTLDQV